MSREGQVTTAGAALAGQFNNSQDRQSLFRRNRELRFPQDRIPHVFIVTAILSG